MNGTDDPIRPAAGDADGTAAGAGNGAGQGTGNGASDQDSGGGTFAPQEAASILGDASATARRRFEQNPPLLHLLRAVVVLVAFGGLWLSVRNQHPYKGPNPAAIVVCYLAVAIALTATAGAMKKANAGITRKDKKAMRASAVALGAAWIGAYVYMSALKAAGASNAIVYGMYPATGPLMIVGLAGAAWSAAREEWRTFGTTLAVAIVAMLSAYGGPRESWLFMGIGLAAVMASAAVATVWQQRSAVVTRRA
jgi:hypothetical protein